VVVSVLSQLHPEGQSTRLKVTLIRRDWSKVTVASQQVSGPNSGIHRLTVSHVNEEKIMNEELYWLQLEAVFIILSFRSRPV